MCFQLSNHKNHFFVSKISESKTWFSEPADAGGDENIDQKLLVYQYVYIKNVQDKFCLVSFVLY